MRAHKRFHRINIRKPHIRQHASFEFANVVIWARGWADTHHRPRTARRYMPANQLKGVKTDHGDRSGECQSIGKGHCCAGRAQSAGTNIHKDAVHIRH